MVRSGFSFALVTRGDDEYTSTPPRLVCESGDAPRNSDLYTLTSHTHQRGSNFTVDVPNGTRIYTSARYSDPVVKIFDPPLRFVAESEADRTLRHCTDFNNGVVANGTPEDGTPTSTS